MSLSDKQFSGLRPQDFNSLHAALRDPNQGGFTISTQTGRIPKRGFSVSIPGHEEVRPLAATRKGHLMQYAQAHKQSLSKPATRHFGGWADDGKAYLDVSNVHPDTKEGEFSTRYDTVQGHQQAYYDITHGETVVNPFQWEGNREVTNTHTVADSDPKTVAWWVMSPLKHGRSSYPKGSFSDKSGSFS